MAEATTQYLILALVVSVLVNFLALGGLFVTGLGQRVWKRWKQRFLYRKGNHVNTIMVYNTGAADELFVRKEDDGSFKVNGKRYTVNRKASMLFDGIPTQLNFEGVAEAIDFLHDPQAEKMSTAELEKIIMNNTVEDFISMAKKYLLLFFIIAAVVVVFAMVSAYFNWKIFDVIVQNGAGTIMGGGR